MKSQNNKIDQKKREKILRKFQGIVVSDKMDKTVVVEVSRVKVHPKYGKRFHVSRKFSAHDEKNQYHVGDKVEIKQVRPISKNKCWQVVAKIK